MIILSIMCSILSVLLIKKNKDYIELWELARKDIRREQEMINNYERRIAILMDEILLLKHEKEFVENEMQ